MKKKDDKVGNKIANKEEGKGKKECERERWKQIRKKKKQNKTVQILGFCACVKNKKLFN